MAWVVFKNNVFLCFLQQPELQIPYKYRGPKENREELCSHGYGRKSKSFTQLWYYSWFSIYVIGHVTICSHHVGGKEQVSVWRPVLTVKMVNSCFVRDCTKKTGDRVGDDKVTFHRIPTVIEHHDAETKKLTERKTKAVASQPQPEKRYAEKY